LGLGQRGAFVLRDAGLQLEVDDLPRLVRLDVRPQSLRSAGDLEDDGEVAPDQVLVEQQGGTVNRGRVGESIERIHSAIRGVLVATGEPPVRSFVYSNSLPSPLFDPGRSS